MVLSPTQPSVLKFVYVVFNVKSYSFDPLPHNSLKLDIRPEFESLMHRGSWLA